MIDIAVRSMNVLAACRNTKSLMYRQVKCLLTMLAVFALFGHSIVHKNITRKIRLFVQ